MSAFQQSVASGLTADAQREALRAKAARAAAQSAAQSTEQPGDEQNESEKSDVQKSSEKSDEQKSSENSNDQKSSEQIPSENSNVQKSGEQNSSQNSHVQKSSDPKSVENSAGPSPAAVEAVPVHGYFLCNECYAAPVFSALCGALHGDRLRLVTAQCCVYLLRFLLTNRVFGAQLPSAVVQDLASLFPRFPLST